MEYPTTLSPLSLAGLLALALSAGAAGCAATPDLVFADADGGAGASDAAPGPQRGSAADSGQTSRTDGPTSPDQDATAVAADAAVPPPGPPPPPATCPNHVPSGADGCCGAVPCVGKKCVESCSECAACAGKACCVGNNQNHGNANGNGNGVSCAPTPRDCADAP